MNNKIGYVLCSLLVVMMMTGCTKYASASPTPEAPQAPQQAATIGIPTPTMAALEVEVATRTPIPLVLKTATPTVSLSEILTATAPEGAATGEVKNPGETPGVEGTMIAGTPIGEQTKTTEMAGVYKTPTTYVFPTRAPMVIIVGKPTISIVSVKYADSITVSITNLDPNTELKIRMGSPSSYGTDGPVVQTVKADATGAVTATYKIPEAYLGYGQIEFRIEFSDGTPYYFPFYNNDY
jgi:hypothetical protein